MLLLLALMLVYQVHRTQSTRILEVLSITTYQHILYLLLLSRLVANLNIDAIQHLWPGRQLVLAHVH